MADEALLDFAALERGCDLGHRGLFVDLGDAHAMPTRVRGTKQNPPRQEVVEHERSTYVRVTANELSTTFLGPDEDWPKGTPLTLEARAQGGSAKLATVLINGRYAGKLVLARNQTKTTTFSTDDLELLRGTNELSFRFSAQAARSADVSAEIDWLRVGPKDDLGAFAPPTRAQASGSFKVGNQLLRGVSLRPPGFLRCTAHVPTGAKIKARLGLLGEGSADVSLELLQDRAEPQILTRVHLDSEQPEPSVVELDVPATAVGALTWKVSSETKGVRVVLGEPRLVVRPEPAPPAPRSEGVVLVVFSGLPAGSFAPGVRNDDIPHIRQLVERGVGFANHRTTSALSGGSLASMLTGQRDHGMNATCKLSPKVLSVPEALRDAGIRSGLFTTNPWSTEAHGLSRGFSTYWASLPNDAEPAYKVFDSALEFIKKFARDRFFVVVHARGGHPPWDINREVLRELPPQNYPGGLDPRHAGELLAKARTLPPMVRFTDADRERMWAMHKVAARGEDDSFARFHESADRIVGDAGKGRAITWIVTGDVGLDLTTAVPFGDGETLNDAALVPGLALLHPGLSPRVVAAPTDTTMVAATVLELFGLALPKSLTQTSLLTVSSTVAHVPLRVAELDKRALAEWGGLSWQFFNGNPTRFCDASLEAECVTDMRPAFPLAAHAVLDRSRAYFAERKTPPCVPADLGTTLQAAIHVWGSRSSL